MLIINEKYNSLKKIFERRVENEADNSWGEIFESIICDAFNTKGDASSGDESYVAITNQKLGDAEKVYKNIYNSLKSKIKTKELHKLSNENPVTSEWKDLGLYKLSGNTPNNTPKTDILGGKYHISVKEASGARLMSGAVNESIATIRAAISTINDKSLQKKANDLFKKLTSSSTRARLAPNETVGGIKKRLKSKDYDPSKATDDEKKVADIFSLIQELNDFVAEVNSNSEVHEAIIREALTGEIKFGKSSTSCANYILTWDDDGNCSVYNIDDYIAKYSSKYKVNSAFKSSSAKNSKGDVVGRDIWMVLSIT